MDDKNSGNGACGDPGFFPIDNVFVSISAGQGLHNFSRFIIRPDDIAIGFCFTVRTGKDKVRIIDILRYKFIL